MVGVPKVGARPHVDLGESLTLVKPVPGIRMVQVNTGAGIGGIPERKERTCCRACLHDSFASEHGFLAPTHPRRIDYPDRRGTGVLLGVVRPERPERPE